MPYINHISNIQQHHPMIKSEIIAIAYSAIVKQIYKLSKSNAEANRRLFALGQQIGLRVSDEYTERSTNSSKPDEVATVFLKGILRVYMGCDVNITKAEMTSHKNRFTIKFKVIIKDNPLCDFIVLGKNQTKQSQTGQNLNYHSIIMGFVSGCMKSMAYQPTVTLVSDSLVNEITNGDMTTSQIMGSSQILGAKIQTTFEVDMWKEKEED